MCLPEVCLLTCVSVIFRLPYKINTIRQTGWSKISRTMSPLAQLPFDPCPLRRQRLVCCMSPAPHIHTLTPIRPPKRNPRRDIMQACTYARCSVPGSPNSTCCSWRMAAARASRRKGTSLDGSDDEQDLGNPSCKRVWCAWTCQGTAVAWT